MNKFIKIGILAVLATVIFYCGGAFRAGGPDASADAGTDAGADAGSQCFTCPDPCPSCPSPVRVEVYNIETSPDASAVIPVPDFDQGVIVQGYSRFYSSGGSMWRGNFEDCTPNVYTEPPLGYPNLQVPAVLFPEGIHRECRIVVIRPGT